MNNTAIYQAVSELNTKIYISSIGESEYVGYFSLTEYPFGTFVHYMEKCIFDSENDSVELVDNEKRQVKIYKTFLVEQVQQMSDALKLALRNMK